MVRQGPGERSARQLLTTTPPALPTRLQPPSGHAVDHPRVVSVEPLAPKPIATTAARMLLKAADPTNRARENPSTSKAAATEAPRASRRKPSRSSSLGSTNDAASEAPKHRSAKRKVSCGGSRHSSRSRHSGRASKARSRESSATWSERMKRRSKSRRHALSASSSSATSVPSKRGRKRRLAYSCASTGHGGRDVKTREVPSCAPSTRHGTCARFGRDRQELDEKVDV
ncbi:hypothetical protein MTO96_037918 [Rhipicephalus appendiculatus]